MDSEEATRMHRLIVVVQAKEQLSLITAFCHTRRDPGKQKSHIKNLQREAHKYDDKPVLTIEQIVQRISNTDG